MRAPFTHHVALRWPFVCPSTLRSERFVVVNAVIAVRRAKEFFAKKRVGLQAEHDFMYKLSGCKGWARLGVASFVSRSRLGQLPRVLAIPPTSAAHILYGCRSIDRCF